MTERQFSQLVFGLLFLLASLIVALSAGALELSLGEYFTAKRLFTLSLCGALVGFTVCHVLEFCFDWASRRFSKTADAYRRMAVGGFLLAPMAAVIGFWPVWLLRLLFGAT